VRGEDRGVGGEVKFSPGIKKCQVYDILKSLCLISAVLRPADAVMSLGADWAAIDAAARQSGANRR
jgi:hypothetical protein